MGPVIAHRPKQCSTTAKTSEWERAGPNPGGAGGIPPRLFASGLSLARNGEKEGRGQAPRTPFFYAHSLPLVPPFALGGAAGTIYRLLRCPFLAPDLGTFLFWEIFLEQIFFARKSYSKFLYPKKKESRSGYDERDRNSPTIVAMWHRAKSRTSGSEWP